MKILQAVYSLDITLCKNLAVKYIKILLQYFIFSKHAPLEKRSEKKCCRTDQVPYATHLQTDIPGGTSKSGTCHPASFLSQNPFLCPSLAVSSQQLISTTGARHTARHPGDWLASHLISGNQTPWIHTLAVGWHHYFLHSGSWIHKWSTSLNRGNTVDDNCRLCFEKDVWTGGLTYPHVLFGN